MIREEFPALAQWTYLNTATVGLLPRRSEAAVLQHFAHRNALGCSDFRSWYDEVDRVRSLVARFIHAEPEDVAFIPNTAAAISLLLNGTPWEPGDQILTLTDEFPNQFYFPAHLARRGVELAQSPPENLIDFLSPRTHLVAISTVNYNTGFTAPLAEISQACRERGILLYLDGTQSAGALPFDAAAIRPAMFAVHGYKWLLSPSGAGFAYVSPELRATLEPATIGWRSDRNWRSFATLNHGDPEFSSSAERYEGGMLDFTALFAMAETIRLMLELGPARIEKQVLSLAREVRGIVRSCGAVVPYEGAGIVAAHWEDRDPAPMVQGLLDAGIVTAARQGRLRISPHFYNDESDLDRLESALRRVV